MILMIYPPQHVYDGTKFFSFLVTVMLMENSVGQLASFLSLAN